MPRGPVPSTEGPRREIATEIPKHNRPYSPATPKAKQSSLTREQRRAKDFKIAVDDLALLNPASAVEKMRYLPLGLLEMYLVAEEAGQARSYILRAFPKPSAMARQKFLPTETPAPAGA